MFRLMLLWRFCFGYLLRRFAQPLHRFDFFPHGSHIPVLGIFLGSQLVYLSLPLFWRDWFPGGFQFFQIPGGGFKQRKLCVMVLLERCTL